MRTSLVLEKDKGALEALVPYFMKGLGGSDRGIHVVEFDDHYEMHIDQFDPRKNPIKHLLIDSPKYGFAIGAVTLGVGTVLALLRRKR